MFLFGLVFTLTFALINSQHCPSPSYAVSGFGSGMNDNVHAVVLHQGVLYAGGAFSSAGGVANTNRIAGWNGTSWFPLGTGIPNGIVYALASINGNLYIGKKTSTLSLSLHLCLFIFIMFLFFRWKFHECWRNQWSQLHCKMGWNSILGSWFSLKFGQFDRLVSKSNLCRRKFFHIKHCRWTNQYKFRC